MSTARRIAELERERSEQWIVLEHASARLRGSDAELQRLRAGTAGAGDLTGQMLTEAVLMVLRSSVSTMTPTEVIARLDAGGRNESATKVNATLAYPEQSNRACNESRAAWRRVCPRHIHTIAGIDDTTADHDFKRREITVIAAHHHQTVEVLPDPTEH